MAAGWALCVCEPSASGLGGQGVLLLHSPNGPCRVIDGHSRAPAAASRGNISRAQQQKGYRSVVIPSLPATLGFAQERFGRLSLERVMRPAIRLAEEGYPISRLQRRQLGWCLADLRASRATRQLFLRKGRRYRVGEILRQKKLAKTLGRLARVGVRDFYEGQLARAIAEDMRAHGGLLSEQDLAGLDLPVQREAIPVEHSGCRVLTVPPPGGGVQLCVGLRILSQLRPWEAQDPAELHAAAAEVIRAVFQERDRWSVHPDDVSPSLLSWVLSEDRAREIAQGIASGTGRRRPDPRGSDGPGETSHVCTADAHGNVVSLTQSIQSMFGAKVAHAELGFLYNNYLRTCPRHRHPYALGGGGMPRSNAAPTIVLGDGSPLLALGAAGSRRIISSVLQVIMGVLDRGLSCAEAVAAPRVHVQLPGRLHVEKPAGCQQVLDRLRARFPRVQVRARHSYFMGAVQAIQRLGETGWVGAADPRRDGAAAGCD